MFAHRLLRDSGTRPEEIAARAWLLAFNRPIMPKESEHAGQFLRKQAEARGGLVPALAAFCLALFNANEFAYVD
jgi:hypothetical protein